VRSQGKGAALFGYTSLYGSVPGGQAQYLRVPQAQFGPVKIPAGTPDEQYLYLSDILPTAYQAVAYADVPDGGTLAVLGLGPVGQMAARIARNLGVERVIGVDPVPERRAAATRFGAETLDPGAVDNTAAALTRPVHRRQALRRMGNQLTTGPRHERMVHGHSQHRCGLSSLSASEHRSTAHSGQASKPACTLADGSTDGLATARAPHLPG
jgi:threonine dehydrogenase-like Zn-dependent dehydrogenase